jgi:hypothetical protein
LGASKEIPEAQDAFLKEAVLASGMKTDPPPSPIYTVCENATLPGLQLQKVCRADISIAHGVSRGLGASKEIPEAQDAFIDECAYASGMETDPPPSPIYTVCENATLQGLQLQKACRADISIAHGVSRGLGASKEIPEAQDAFFERGCSRLRNENGCLGGRLHHQFKSFIK